MATQGTVAFERVIDIPGLTASADLSAQQHRLVVVSGNYTVNLAGDDSFAIGVLVNKPTSGQAAAVAGPGSIVKCVAGGTIAAGNKLTPNTNGDGSAVACAASDDPVVGIALEGASSGDQFTLLVAPGIGFATATP